MLIDALLALSREADFPLYHLCVRQNDTMQTAHFLPTNEVQPVYSVSKTLTATAAGILISRGMLSVEESVYDLLHPLGPEDCREEWREVTLGHLLSHTTGISGMMLDLDCDRAEDYPTNDYLAICLRAPLVTKPGSAFAYSDSNFYLASRMIAARYGRPLQELLRTELFNPLAFQGHAVATCPAGHALGGTGMFFRVQDLCKLGALYQQGGVWQDKRILSEAWCDLATAPHSPDGGYGYGLWRSTSCPCYSFAGMYGQLVFVSRTKPIVVALTTYDREGKCRIIEDFLRKECC